MRKKTTAPRQGRQTGHEQVAACQIQCLNHSYISLILLAGIAGMMKYLRQSL